MSDKIPDPYNNPDEKAWSIEDKTETVLDVNPTLTERILAEFKISDYTFDKNLQNLKYKNRKLTKTKTAAKILNKIQKKYPDDYKKSQLKVKTSLLNLTAFKINQIQEHHAHNKLKVEFYKISQQNDILMKKGLRKFKNGLNCDGDEGKLRVEGESGIQEDENQPYFGDGVQKPDELYENSQRTIDTDYVPPTPPRKTIVRPLSTTSDEGQVDTPREARRKKWISSQKCHKNVGTECTPLNCQDCVGWRLDSSEKNETIKNLHSIIMEYKVKLESSERRGEKMSGDLKKMSDQTAIMKKQVTSMLLNSKNHSREVFDLKKECAKLNMLKRDLVWQILDERTYQQSVRPTVKKADVPIKINNETKVASSLTLDKTVVGKKEDSKNTVITAMVKSENLKNENTVLEHKYLSLGSKFTELKTENENLKTKIMNHDCFWEANTENEALNQITYSVFKNRFQTTAAWLN